jgi:hypothetical protein
MFVENCSSATDSRVLLRDEEEGDALFAPVHCGSCGTHLGYQGEDEVFHFTDAIPSLASE